MKEDYEFLDRESMIRKLSEELVQIVEDRVKYYTKNNYAFSEQDVFLQSFEQLIRERITQVTAYSMVDYEAITHLGRGSERLEGFLRHTNEMMHHKLGEQIHKNQNYVITEEENSYLGKEIRKTCFLVRMN